MAKRKQKISREVQDTYTHPHQPVPAVSVIIPLYNVEKYIGECLDSILAQTFQNFEVIVVDDCSTDSSCAIVESYRDKFGGRLTLSRMKKNSGGAGFPRNKGIKFAHGEYIHFMDPDDTITPTAYEELYALAKEYDADVVHCEKWYNIPDELWHDSQYRKNLKPANHLTGEKIFITKPTLFPENFEQRVLEFSKFWLVWSTCNQLIRRSFLAENEITFGNFFYSEDMIFTICEICCTKKYLVVPNVIYNYRKREGSATSKKDTAQTIHQRIQAIVAGISQLDNFLNDIDFYVKRPDLKYILFNAFSTTIFNSLKGVYSKIPAPALDAFLRKEFGDRDNAALMAFIFNKINVQHIQLQQIQYQFQQFAAQAQTRIAQLEAEVKRLKQQE